MIPQPVLRVELSAACVVSNGFKCIMLCFPCIPSLGEGNGMVHLDKMTSPYLLSALY